MQAFCQFSSSLELNHLLGRNLNLSLGCRINARASGTLSDSKCTETDKGYFIIGLQRAGNGAESCIQCILCICFGQISARSDSAYKICFVHNLTGIENVSSYYIQYRQRRDKYKASFRLVQRKHSFFRTQD